VTVLGLRDWSFFAEVPRLALQLPRADGVSGAVLVVRMRDVRELRSTGIRVLNGYHRLLARTGNVLVLAGVRDEVVRTLDRTGTTEKLGRENVFPAEAGITEALDDAVSYARTLIADGPGTDPAQATPEA
jgi:SulP family sulfate permease